MICNSKKENGMTLIEILLSMALLAVVAGAGLSMGLGVYVNDSSRRVASEVSHALRIAERSSIGAIGSSTWGVSYLTDKAVFFKGSSYATRDTSYDLEYRFGAAIVASTSLSEIVFALYTGLPSATGTIELTSYGGGREFVEVNNTGAVLRSSAQ